MDPIISGTVVDKETGLPVANATVKLFDSTSILAQTTTTDINGNFTFLAVLIGTFRVEVSKTSYLTSSAVLDVLLTLTLNFSLAPNCICEAQTEIAAIEGDIIAEKQRIYQIFTAFFLTQPANDTTLMWLNQINECTGNLDCCAAKVLAALTCT